MLSFLRHIRDKSQPLSIWSFCLVLAAAFFFHSGIIRAQASLEEDAEEQPSSEEESPEDILIIANNGVEANSISIDEVQDLFFKQRLTWSSGDRAVVINASDGSELRKTFQKQVLEMNSVEEQRYWQINKIKSGLTPPAEFSNTLKAVYKLKNSISYIYRSQYKEGVAKIILVIPAS